MLCCGEQDYDRADQEVDATLRQPVQRSGKVTPEEIRDTTRREVGKSLDIWGGDKIDRFGLNALQVSVNVNVGLMMALIDHMSSYEFACDNPKMKEAPESIYITPAANRARIKFEDAMREFYMDRDWETNS